MATFIVTTGAGLLQALRTARSGDVVQLEAGTYSGVQIKNLNLANVTIESKNPDQPAVFTNLMIRESSGIVLRNVDFNLAANTQNPFQVLNSSNVRIDNVHVHGSLNGNPVDDPNVTGLLIRNSRNVTLTNSEFEELEFGVAHMDSNGLVFSGNSFHDLRTDGIRGGGSSNVLIERNTFTDFYPQNGDHPDAIQFWTTATTASARNIVVRDNQITRGEGGAAQGIFFRDQVGTLPYENVTITNNIVVGGMYNGIMVGHANNLTLSNNEVISFADMKSWIRIDGSTNVWMQGNEAIEYIYNRVSRLHDRGNETNQRASDGGTSALREWLEDRGTGSDGPTKSMKPVVSQSPQEAASQSGAEALTGHDGFSEGRVSVLRDFARRGGEVERASSELFADVGGFPLAGLRAHIEALRLAVEGRREVDGFDHSAASPLIEEALGVEVDNFGLVGPVFAETAAQAPSVVGNESVAALVDLPFFVPALQFPSAAEFIL